MTIDAPHPLWHQAGIGCVVVPRAPGYDVQLKNAAGVAAVLTKPCRLDTFLAAARLFLRTVMMAGATILLS